MRLPFVAASLALPAILAATPASAQFFWQSPDFTGAPLQPGEAGIGVPLPGATVAEERANWVWQLRAGLNVAELQCTFDKTLLAEDSYIGVLKNHAAELDYAYGQLKSYFARTTKNAKAAQNALDRWGTQTYSQFSTVQAQYGFCQTASRIGKPAQFAARGSLTLFAVEHLREMRNSLVPAGEQYFRASTARLGFAMPNFDSKCWDRRGNYVAACGTITD